MYCVSALHFRQFGDKSVKHPVNIKWCPFYVDRYRFFRADNEKWKSAHQNVERFLFLCVYLITSVPGYFAHSDYSVLIGSCLWRVANQTVFWVGDIEWDYRQREDVPSEPMYIHPSLNLFGQNKTRYCWISALIICLYRRISELFYSVRSASAPKLQNRSFIYRWLG